MPDSFYAALAALPLSIVFGGARQALKVQEVSSASASSSPFSSCAISFLNIDEQDTYNVHQTGEFCNFDYTTKQDHRTILVSVGAGPSPADLGLFHGTCSAAASDNAVPSLPRAAGKALRENVDVGLLPVNSLCNSRAVGQSAKLPCGPDPGFDTCSYPLCCKHGR